MMGVTSLLHDIGHGPYSHVSDFLLEKFYDPVAAGGSTAREKIHEKITVDVICKVSEIADLLSPDQRESVSEIIGGGLKRNFRRDIVSSSLDADKMDYLLRDAHFTGVKYGIFDLDKVVESSQVYGDQLESYLMIDEEGLFAVEQLILAKHHMTQQVYAHRVRTITDYMIVRGLELAVEEGNQDVKRLYSYDGSVEFLYNYISNDDDSLSAQVRSSAYGKSKSIFDRLHRRQLFKELALFQLDQTNFGNAVTLGHLLNLERPTMVEMEKLIASKLGLEEWEVIVQKKSVRNPAYQNPGEIDPDEIFVVARNGIPRTMSQFPAMVGGRAEAVERLHVIGPVESLSSGRDELEIRIKETILGYLGG